MTSAGNSALHAGVDATERGGSVRAGRPTTVARSMLGGRSRLAALVLGALICLAPAAALAHPLIDEGLRRYGEADLPGALDALTQAEHATDLTRDDLVQLYLGRAMVHHAMGHATELEADVFRLATLEPALTLRRTAPPPVRLAYEQAAARVPGPMRLDVEVHPTPDGVELVAHVTDDSAGLVQAVRIRARTLGGTWRRSALASIELPAAAGAAVEYVAEAVGPGGAVLVSAGTESTPVRVTTTVAAPGGGASATADRTGADAAGRDDHGLGLWPWVIGGGALLVAAVVLIAVLASSSSDDQHISGLMVTF